MFGYVLTEVVLADREDQERNGGREQKWQALLLNCAAVSKLSTVEPPIKVLPLYIHVGQCIRSVDQCEAWLSNR